MSEMISFAHPKIVISVYDGYEEQQFIVDDPKAIGREQWSLLLCRPEYVLSLGNKYIKVLNDTLFFVCQDKQFSCPAESVLVDLEPLIDVLFLF